MSEASLFFKKNFDLTVNPEAFSKAFHATNPGASARKTRFLKSRRLTFGQTIYKKDIATKQYETTESIKLSFSTRLHSYACSYDYSASFFAFLSFKAEHT